MAESTVSHVLNNTRFVSPGIREKVLAAMRDLDYHGNAHARRLARGSSDFLGLIISVACNHGARHPVHQSLQSRVTGEIPRVGGGVQELTRMSANPGVRR